MAKNLLAVSGLASFIALSWCTQPGLAQARHDLGKAAIEQPLEKALTPGSTLPLSWKTFGVPAKGGTVPPSASSGSALQSVKADARRPITGGHSAEAPAFVNPKVAPGQISWRTDFQTACEKSKSSGKPVLLFQMMGKLDDGFC
jgi:hypothetical protein